MAGRCETVIVGAKDPVFKAIGYVISSLSVLLLAISSWDGVKDKPVLLSCLIAGAAMWLAVPVALFIGGIGAVSVFKAVYIDKRELKCACVGGSSNVPLGFVSLTENVMMVAMAIWMLAR